MKSPATSVIIPVYNVDAWLEECLDSVLAQTETEIEIICVNDGSTDGSEAILERYSKRDERIFIINKENGGLSTARNAGLDKAKGKYIYFLDSDDTIRSDAIKTCKETSDKNQLDILYFDAKIIFEDEEGRNINSGSEYYYIRNESYSGVLSGTEIFNRMVPASDYKPSVCIQFFNRSFIENCGLRFEEGILFEDNVFSLQLMLKAKKVMHIPQTLFFRRFRTDSIMSSGVNAEKIYCSFYITKRMKKELAGYKFDAETQNNAAEFLLSYEPWVVGFYEGADDEQRKMAEERMSEEELMELERMLERAAPKISVIIPVYNAGKWLKACIESLLAQTLTETEIIFVNDGSVDNSLSILEEFRKKDSRISIITQANLGAGAARNRGLDIVRGEYLSFLDADDFFEPDMLEKAYACCTEHNADICIFRFDRGNERNGYYGVFGYDPCLIPDKEYFNYTDVEKDFFNITNPAIWNKLLRRRFIKESNIRFQKIPSTNDMYFTYKALTDADRIVVLSDILIHYREGDDDSISNNREKDWHCVFLALNAIREEIIIKKLHLEKDFVNLVVRQALYLFDVINNIEAFRAILTEIRDLWIKTFNIDYNYPLMFYNSAVYERFQAMMIKDTEEYLYYEAKRNRKNSSELVEKQMHQTQIIEALENELSKKNQLISEIGSLRNHIKYFIKKKIGK